jgi:hypothetical protein
MKIYKTKAVKIPGTDFKEVHRKAFNLYQEIKRRSKRRPYIRSAYFRKDKIFLGLFWQHLYEKRHYVDQMRRMKLFPCGIELIKFTHFDPESKENPNKRSEILHRFAGMTEAHELFFVHIKEDKRTGEKFLISVFPVGK